MNTYEFGKTSEGKTVNAYIIENINGIRVEFLDFGCVLRQFWVPKADGAYVNIVHGLDSVREYEDDRCYFGAFVGRFANRIKDSRFTLNGKEYVLEPNDGPNHLHGCWCKKVFCAGPLPAKTLEEASKGVIFTYHSPDMEDGFPGNVDVKVTYILDDDNVLHMDYEAVSDKDTVINVTNHSYFNLGADQVLMVNADRYLEITDDIIPTGRIMDVSENSIMDLRTPKNIDKEYPPSGYFDHCFILNRNGTEDVPDVKLTAKSRGITMTVKTGEPAVQIYSGNNSGIAIETQMYPCAPNFPQFPSALLKKGEIRKWHNEYKIFVDF